MKSQKKKGKTGKLGSGGSRFRWEAVMFLFNVVNPNVRHFFIILLNVSLRLLLLAVGIGLVPSALLSASSTRTSFY